MNSKSYYTYTRGIVMHREKYLDNLRVIAMFAVLFKHSWGYFSCDNFQLYSGTIVYYVDVI